MQVAARRLISALSSARGSLPVGTVVRRPFSGGLHNAIPTSLRPVSRIQVRTFPQRLSPVTSYVRAFATNDKPADGDNHGAGTPAEESPVHVVEKDQQALVDPSDRIPPQVMVLPNYSRPLFPGLVAAHVILDDNLWQDIVNLVKSGTKILGVFYAKDKAREKKIENITSLDDIYQVGVAARVIKLVPGLAGHGNVMWVVGRKRIAIDSIIRSSPRLMVKANALDDLPYSPDMSVRASVMEIYRIIKELVKLNPFFKEQLQSLVELTDVNKPNELADMSAALTTSEGPKLQEILEMLSVPDRLYQSLTLLRKELDLTELQQNINKKLEEQMSAKQKQFFLQEQLKNIKRELGLEKDEKEELVKKLKGRIEKLKLPADAKRVVDDEMTKISTLEPTSAEYNISRNYLEWLTTLPWGVHTEENLNIHTAQKILNRDHYGLQDIKDRILEFIAVGQLKGTVQGKIICFVGPPGVGKTSIGKSIAASLNRKFFRFSVGGMSDVSEIKGHRRTYVGAMPGKLIQGLKKVESANPVVMIDEIDKLGVSHQGDPASALLEVLDPEQNGSFMDHYLDTSFDLSKVLFVCTANSLDTIAKPLLDRMEVIRLSGYVLEEKVHISQQYLIPAVRGETGLTASQIQIPEETIKMLVKGYAREAGVRNLRKLYERIHRKVALEKARTKSGWRAVTVTTDKLEHYVGKPQFTKDRIYDSTPAGVVMGLAWTSMGGSTLFIECVNSAGPEGGKPEMQVSGQLGDVMKESGRIAYTYAQNYLRGLDAKNSFFNGARIHLHVPEGATPKDGPSAGIAMVTALLSLAMDKPIREAVAMTGEVTLIGKVLPIGGVKEKTIAAQRANVKHLILPEDNRRDFEELPANIRHGLRVHYASDYSQVYDAVFGNAKGESSVVKRDTKKKKKPVKKAAPTEVTAEAAKSEGDAPAPAVKATKKAVKKVVKKAKAIIKIAQKATEPKVSTPKTKVTEQQKKKKKSVKKQPGRARTPSGAEIEPTPTPANE